ncbi:DUF2254 domain-containing protein [Saccharophagus degradans]|nr:DUF2254 domain-containing protein [Saccharophagus degradans]
MSIEAILFHTKKVTKNLSFRCLLYCVFALTAFFTGSLLEPFVPNEIKDLVTPQGLKGLLTILASSMLAVTTFSLSILVQAYATVATTATPRASKLIMENDTAQNALGTFIGAFLFSVIGLIGISSNYYQENMVVVLFLFTVVMIFLIIIMLLRWIDQLSKLGRIDETIDVLEQALAEAIDTRSNFPALNANILTLPQEDLGKDKCRIYSAKVGHVQHIDLPKLNALAAKLNLKIYITVGPGDFVDSITPMAYIDGDCSEETQQCVVDALSIGNTRTFSQDPRYGLIVLSEIALRALSPSTNDPGTAIQILSSYVKAIKLWDTNTSKNHRSLKNDRASIKFEHVYMYPIQESDLFEDMFAALLPAAMPHKIVTDKIRKSLLSFQQLNNKKITDCANDWLNKLNAHSNSLRH